MAEGPNRHASFTEAVQAALADSLPPEAMLDDFVGICRYLKTNDEGETSRYWALFGSRDPFIIAGLSALLDEHSRRGMAILYDGE